MRILIVGAGRVGRELAKRLSQAGYSVTIVDKDGEKLEIAQSEADVEGLQIDVTDPRFYSEIDIPSYDVLVAATDKDEVNLFLVAMAMAYGMEKIYVRVRMKETVRILTTLGVYDMIVEPDIIAGLLYSGITGKGKPVLLSDVFVGRYVVAAATVTKQSPVRGQRLRDVLRSRDLEGRVKVLAVFDGNEIREPEEVVTIEEGHTIIALVDREYLEEFAKLY
ncbi:Trk system potassium uptake protein TrkA [Aeropyrum pernix K1]|uniref:Trk system potassium uptake protein TrkA n=2 Tax=Aeropyrum pernix TaxID=56636 RepID=Q9Y929_AERPE|nr:TrkA family potassium uptake protein [Aeropyrum pernix]BAA81471.2 Trk system potassium uptake protein TrkA [Aeropyrum pernix K1]GBF08602.1 Trk system potassium uptake protein TrkA [Aeropyrum pernix]